MNPPQAFLFELLTVSSLLEKDARDINQGLKNLHHNFKNSNYNSRRFVDQIDAMANQVDEDALVLESIFVSQENSLLRLGYLSEICSSIFRDNEKLITQVEQKLSKYGYQPRNSKSPCTDPLPPF